MIDPKVSEAVRLLGVYTAGRFDPWDLAGSSKASCRAHVMSALAGVRVPQSKSGVFAMEAALFAAVVVPRDCKATMTRVFIETCKAMTQGGNHAPAA